MNEVKHQPVRRGDKWRVVVTQGNGHTWSRTFYCRDLNIGADHYAEVVNTTTGWAVEVVAV
jgi:hypothetical protein